MLARTVAAATIIAGDIDSYLADVWPLAAPLVKRAQRRLGEALGLLDQANHRCILTPSAFEDDDAAEAAFDHLHHGDPIPAEPGPTTTN